LQNATLAVYLARSFLQSKILFNDDGNFPESFITGLKKTKWPGRCQTIDDPRREKVAWYLDGAHTTESLDCCMQWFVSPGVGLQSDQVRYVAARQTPNTSYFESLAMESVYWCSTAPVVALVALS
jgi:folylpolyglutamate synthase